jgi:8-oxo-dGTP pyrophosphatase MutT (NUDIX family)
MASTTKDAAAGTTQGSGATVIAAGTLCWRIEKGLLEVLIIHRPRYKDWSWPKGKLDPGETTPECAVRETFEEVGLSVTLGIPLATISYPVSSGDKVVHYWAARSPRPTARRWTACNGSPLTGRANCSATRPTSSPSTPSSTRITAGTCRRGR